MCTSNIILMIIILMLFLFLDVSRMKGFANTSMKLNPQNLKVVLYFGRFSVKFFSGIVNLIFFRYIGKVADSLCHRVHNQISRSPDHLHLSLQHVHEVHLPGGFLRHLVPDVCQV